VDFQEVGCEDLGWIHLALGRGMWQDFVKKSNEAVVLIKFGVAFLMCGIPCIFVYDSSNHTNTCTIHFFTIKPTRLHVSASPGRHQGVTRLPKMAG
jgi:hypothetical protein